MQANVRDVRAEASPTRRRDPFMTEKGRLPLALALTLGACLAGPTAYGSRAPTGDINHNGNGTGNHNALSIRSPTRNSGVQAISNANAGGTSSSRNAMCKRSRVCHIRQWGGFP
jgi:hypothetical protein